MASRDGRFGEFFAAHYAPVVRGLTLATGNAQLAEDAAQEAFARAVRKWSRVRRMERPVGWVWVVAMNVARRQARRVAREEPGAVDASAAVTVADAGAAVTTRIALREAIAALPRRQREAVVLRYFADLSIDETANAMGCATGTVKSAVHAALASLRIELDDEDDDED
jgi:RNA polymerase sigma-70 factor (sigma-E family)